MSDFDSADGPGDPARVKVGRLIREYSLGDVGAELEERWTGEDGERDSLRTLADAFNERLLERAMLDAGMDPITGEPENVYRILTDDDVSPGVRTETETRLEQQGLDVDTLRTDFVTYQAIRTFLREVRGASYERDAANGIDDVRSVFARLVGRTTAVVEQKLTQLRSSGRLRLGTFHVRTVVTVYCKDCETQYEVTALLDRGGCNCSEAES